MDPHRRRLLRGISGLPLVSLAALPGCGDGGEAVTCAPRAFADGEACHVCGMTIAGHPGPKAQACLADGRVIGFCSTNDLFNWVLQPENVPRVRQTYVHDMGATDWEHPADATLVDARKAWFVVGDPRPAAMGPTLIPFADGERARDHAASLEEGAVLGYEEVDWEVLNALTEAGIEHDGSHNH